jgi:YXWGXW repeat-containing protein
MFSCWVRPVAEAIHVIGLLPVLRQSREVALARRTVEWRDFAFHEIVMPGSGKRFPRSPRPIAMTTYRMLATSAVALLMAGCVVAQPVVVRRPPPPPPVRVEIAPVAPTPAHVWIPGHWGWHREHYVWVPGHWEVPASPGYVWVPGGWMPREGGYVWVEGHWRAR